MTTSRTDREMPLDFRSAVVKQIMGHIAAGDSCAVVGIGSVGKTNTLRFLCRPEVKRRYLEDEAERTLILYLDCNNLVRQSRWGFFELMLYRLVQAAQECAPGSDELHQVEALYQHIQGLAAKKLAIRDIDSALNILIHHLGMKVVFLIDEFDRSYRKLPRRVFAGLRALRDSYKYLLVYVTATRVELNQLRKPVGDIESFAELVTPRTVWIGPYSASDALSVIQQIQTRYQTAQEQAWVDEALRLSGGHPGLFKIAAQAKGVPLGTLGQHLAEQKTTSEECYRILNSLPAEEQQALAALAAGRALPPAQQHILDRLEKKGLSGGPWAAPGTIFSSVFQQFLVTEKPVTGRHIRIDREKGLVWIDGQMVEKIGRKEYLLLALLDQKHGEMCTYDEIIRALFPDDKELLGMLPNDQRIKGIVKRLRKTLKNMTDDDLIETIRGEGIRLND